MSEEVGFAGDIDQLGDFEHALVHRHLLQLGIDADTEEQAEYANAQPPEQQGVPRGGPTEVHLGGGEFFGEFKLRLACHRRGRDDGEKKTNGKGDG